MKRFILITIFIILICGATFYFVSLPHSLSDVTATNGMLDLTGEDFSNTLFRLDGEWEFYNGEFFTPEYFAGTQFINSDIQFIKIPKTRNEIGISSHGFATYRLTVKSSEPELMIFIPKIAEAGIVWINGQKVYEAGKTGRSAAETVSGTRNVFTTFKPDNGHIEIVVQTANFGWHTYLPQYSMEVGRPGVLLNDALVRRIILLFVLGALLISSIINFILFIYRCEKWIYLTMTFLYLIVAMRFALETNSIVYLLLPGGVGAGLSRIYVLTKYLMEITLIVFTHIVFKISIKSKMQRLFYLVLLIFPLIIIFIIPRGTVDPQIMYISMLPMFITLFKAVRSNFHKNNPYYILYLVAMTVFCFWYPIYKVVLNDALFLPDAATILFLIISQYIMLTIGYVETKQREEELIERTAFLEKLNRIKMEFLQDMSHEMKTPLTVIATGIDYADRQLKKESGNLVKASSAIETAQNEVQRLGRMVGGMVKVATIKDISENRERIDFAALLRESTESFLLVLERQNVNLTVEIKPGLPDVYIEKDLFVQVLTNLFSNAADHTRDGQISLKVDFDSAYITVSMTDTGEGIEADVLPDVFKRGFSGRGGTGFGLYLCKTIVEAHGGVISIESALGKGTTVTFTIPVYSGQKAGHRI